MQTSKAVRSLVVCLFLFAAAGASQEALPLKARQARVERGGNRGRNPQPSLPRRFTPGWSHFFIHFEGGIPGDGLEALAAQGVRLVGYVPNSTLVVSAPDGVNPGGVGPGDGLRKMLRFESLDKISPLIEDLAGGRETFVVEFHPDVDMDEARAWVGGEEFQQMGVERMGHPDLLANQLLVRATPEAAVRLTAWDEVDYIFPASEELKNGERVVGCAGALSAPGVIGQYVKVGSGWPSSSGGFAGPASLSYVFGPMTGKLPMATAHAEIARALAEWTHYGNVRFSPGLSGSDPRTVYIFFASQFHGDPFPFDGPGRVLAHTFYPAPLNSEPIAGDMHLDNDEAWRIGLDTDLFSVALHEAGHALGLGHSDQPGAVMYPYYKMSAGLSPDDIQGVQALYGAATGSVPPSTPSPALAITSPVPAVSTQASSIVLAGTSAAVTQMSWSNSRGGTGSILPGSTWSAGPIALQLGDNLLTVTAADATGATISRSVAVTRTTPPPPLDRTPPSLLITSPAATIVSTSAVTIALSGIASDDTGVTAVRWTCTSGSSGDAAGASYWRIDAVPLRVGTSTITVRAFDAAGNSSWRSITVVRR